jgi:hypothetical protein
MASKRPWLGSLLGLVESDCIAIIYAVQYMPRGEHVVDRTMTGAHASKSDKASRQSKEDRDAKRTARSRSNDDSPKITPGAHAPNDRTRRGKAASRKVDRNRIRSSASDDDASDDGNS